MKILVIDMGKMDLTNPILTRLKARGHDYRVRELVRSSDANELTEDLKWSDIVFVTYLAMDRATYMLTNLAAKTGLKLAVWTELDLTVFQPINFGLVNWEGVAICFGDNPAVLKRYEAMVDAPTKFIYSPRVITQVPFCSDVPTPFQLPDNKTFDKKIGLAGAYWRAWKRPFLALECYRRLRERDSGWTLEMVGSNPEFRSEELETEAADLGVNLLPLVDRLSELIPWYQRMDIALNTSDHEGNPKTVIEGILCGNFPMVRNWPGASELYPEECVFGGPNEFVEKALAWQALPPGRKRGIAINNREDFLRKYRPGVLTTIVEQAFMSILRSET